MKLLPIQWDSVYVASVSLLFFKSLRLCVLAVILSAGLSAQPPAPGGPGKDAQWATAGKQAIGTSATRESKVWFTLAQGVMTEVYYPDVTVANVHMLQFVVVNPKTKKVETERDDAISQVQSLSFGRKEKLLNLPTTTSVASVTLSEIYRNYSFPNSLVFRQINKAHSGEWTITKTYLTDPQTNSVLIAVDFDSNNPDAELYLYFDPSIANTGMHDTAWTQGRAFLAQDGAVVSALVCGRCAISEMTNGFFGVSDGLTQLTASGRITGLYDRAEIGNVVQVAKVKPVGLGKNRTRGEMLFALGFGRTPDEAIRTTNASLTKGFEKAYQEYQIGWIDYLKTIPTVDAKYQAQFNMAAMVMKAQEDKTVPGANVASLTVPWGGGANANEDVGGGYHLIWSRDLYHVFTAYMAIGDRGAAERALDFLFKIQQKEDGSFPQNSWLDGKRGWGSLQMDEVGYPLIMAWQLGRFDKGTYEKHVKRAADFIVRNGPFTPQERWEERPGYSPSTIAAEIAGLVCAADIAKRNGDEASALIWLAAADDWARNVERWTATTKGKHGDGNYYIRISEKGEPDGGHKIELNNNAGTFPETDIVDAGFLELVRLGIKPADHPLIAKSLKVIDEVIKVETPNGPAFYRYLHDGYGEMPDGRRWNWDGKYTGKGRLWALLSGERAQYEIALCTKADTRPVGSPRPDHPCFSSAKTRLDHMHGFANEGLMIPEQIWDKKEIPANVDRQFIPALKFGEGTGSATPLAWSMAQFIRLLTNIKAGKNLDTPQVVHDRYKNGIPAKTNNFGGMDEEAIIPLKPGATVDADRQAQPGTRVAFHIGGRTQIVTAGADGKAKTTFTMPTEPTVALVGVQAADGSTAFERVKVLNAPPEQKFTADEIEEIKTSTKSPIVDGENAIFFFRGKADFVGIAGDLTAWNGNSIFMQKIGEDLFAYKKKLARDARVEYKYTVNGKWELDPLNDISIDNGVGGRNNVLEMPGYAPNQLAFGEALKHDEFEIASKAFGTRKIRVYLPRNYQNSTERFGAIYFHDGSEYASRAGAPHVLEALLKDKRIKPSILVLIDSKDRNKEYWANDAWADLVAGEVVPEIDRRYRTFANRDGRAVIGASLGGITSLNIALRHPDKFSRIGAQSASFWVDNERVVKGLENLDAAKTPLRFYIDDGVFEGVDDSRRMNVMLRARGFPVTYIEGQTGHNWTAWRDRLAEAFVALMN